MESTMATPSEATVSKVDARAGKYLTFHLDNEEFGIQVASVREIIGIQEITSLPQMPDFVQGVINLRGKVVPVIDLRLKFGLVAAEFNQRTCIIVVEVRKGSATILIGAIVDAVSEVMTLPASEIEDTPDFGSGVRMPCLLGMAKTKGKVRILLDIGEVLIGGDVGGLSEALNHGTL